MKMKLALLCGLLALCGTANAGVVTGEEGKTVEATVGDTVRCSGFPALGATFEEKVTKGEATVKPCEDCKVIPGGPVQFDVTAEKPGTVVVELTMKMNGSGEVEKKTYTIDFKTES